MAFQALKHELTPASVAPVARSFSGDDSNHNEQVKERPGFRHQKHKFRLESKGIHTEIPTFCGTLNTPSGSFAEPDLLAQRVIYRAQLGRINEAALAYAEHCSRLSKIIEGCIPYLSGRQIEMHTMTRRFLQETLRRQGRGLIGWFWTKLRPGHYDLSF